MYVYQWGVYLYVLRGVYMSIYVYVYWGGGVVSIFTNIYLNTYTAIGNL